jgi:hypothetical protein
MQILDFLHKDKGTTMRTQDALRLFFEKETNLHVAQDAAFACKILFYLFLLLIDKKILTDKDVDVMIENWK